MSIASEPMKECRLGAGQRGKTPPETHKSHEGNSHAVLHRERQEAKQVVPAQERVRKKVESQGEEMKDFDLEQNSKIRLKPCLPKWKWLRCVKAHTHLTQGALRAAKSLAKHIRGQDLQTLPLHSNC